MQIKKAILTTGVSLTVLFSVAFISLCRYQPTLPERWQHIHHGQLRSEVLTLLPELETNLYDMKRLDQAWRFSESPIFGHVSQYLIIVYGPDDRVSDIQVRTLTHHFRLLRSGSYISRRA